VNLFVQGLNPRTRAESIQNYFEAIGRPAVVKDGILFNMEHTEALVIFQQKPGKFSYSYNVKENDVVKMNICGWYDTFFPDYNSKCIGGNNLKLHR
jgi:hypothetical protein